MFASYIGETTRHICTRVREHLLSDKTSHIYKHLQSSKACLDSCGTECFTILDSAASKYKIKLRNLFSVKDSVPPGLRSRVVYKFSCAGCNASYIGETTRHICTRVREHLLSDKTSHNYYISISSPLFIVHICGYRQCPKISLLLTVGTDTEDLSLHGVRGKIIQV